MRNWKRWLALVLTIIAAMSFPVLAAAEEGDTPDDRNDGAEPDGGYEQPEEPAEEDTPQPTEQPTEQPTLEPTEEPAQAAEEETSTPEPEQTNTPAPAEDAGVINLNVYAITRSDAPASGYTVRIGGASGTANDQGLVQFQNLPVEEQMLYIVSPDGAECSARLYMSRSGSTGITDRAMGPTYGIDIARGQHDVYMVAMFDPDDGLSIRSLSNSMPSLPEAAAPEPVQEADIEYRSKSVTVSLLTEDGKGIPGLALSVEGDGFSEKVSTDSRGQVALKNMPFGTYAVTASMDGAEVARFALTMNPANATAIRVNTPPEFVVDSSVHAQRLFLEFRQASQTLLLTGASDSPIGGMSSLMIGIIAIAAVIVAAIVIIVVARRRHKRREPRMRPTIRTNSKYNQSRMEAGDDSLNDVQGGVKRTGGANKFNVDSFDDRSRM